MVIVRRHGTSSMASPALTSCLLMVIVRAGGWGNAPGGGKGLHARGHLLVLGHHLVSKGFDGGIGSFLLSQLAELDLVDVGLCGGSKELLVIVRLGVGLCGKR